MKKKVYKVFVCIEKAFSGKAAAAGLRLAKSWNDRFCLSKLLRYLTGRILWGQESVHLWVVRPTRCSGFVMACLFSPKGENYSNRYKWFRELRKDSLFSELYKTVDLVKLISKRNIRRSLTTRSILIELLFTSNAHLQGQQTFSTQSIYTHLKTPLSEE